MDCINYISSNGRHPGNVCKNWYRYIKGLTTNIRNNYPKPILYLMILFTFPAVILNIGADIAGMGAAANLIFPSIPSYFFHYCFYRYPYDNDHLPAL
jgi:hypothetical protein